MSITRNVSRFAQHISDAGVVDIDGGGTGQTATGNNGDVLTSAGGTASYWGTGGGGGGVDWVVISTEQVYNNAPVSEIILPTGRNSYNQLAISINNLVPSGGTPRLILQYGYSFEGGSYVWDDFSAALVAMYAIGSTVGAIPPPVDSLQGNYPIAGLANGVSAYSNPGGAIGASVDIQTSNYFNGFLGKSVCASPGGVTEFNTFAYDALVNDFLRITFSGGNNIVSGIVTVYGLPS